MRWRADKLRWLLLVGVLLLTGVVLALFGLAHYRAGKIWKRILARNGVNLRQETNGFTYSQSSGGRTVFTLHASKAVPLGKNRWALHDAVLILYGRQSGRDDRIYGSEFQYDQEQGIARAIGDVHMDLQAPVPGSKAPAAAPTRELSFGPENEAAEDPGVIHVRTSGLVYMRKLGIAATGEPAEFRYRGITCTSRGAEFDSGQSTVRLLAYVRMTGVARESPFVLTAGHAELQRTTNTADLTAPVLVSGERSGRAAHAVLHFSKAGSMEAAEAAGAVELRSGTETVGAPRMTMVLGEENRPQHASLLQGVSYLNTDRSKPAQGGAGTVDLNWTPEGLLSVAKASGTVRFTEGGTGRDGAVVKRELQAQEAVASFTPGVGRTGAAAKRAVLRRVHLTGGAQLRSASQPSVGGQAATTQVRGDDLTTVFGVGATGRPVAQMLSGMGHTQLDQTAADGARQRSVGDTLDIAFAPAGEEAVGTSQAQVSTALQQGHVQMESWTAPKATAAGGTGAPELTTGRAAKAEFAASAKTLTLSGDAGEHAVVDGNQGEVAGAQIVVHQATGDAEASGGVVATNLGRDGGPATHVLASRARLLHAANLSVFEGEAGRPVQMWQGGSQVQAAEILLDGRTHQVSARPQGSEGLVHAIFATTEGRDAGERKAGPGRRSGTGVTGESVPEAERNAVRVSAGKMDFDDLHHQAVFTGNVRLEGTMGEITAERGVAFLSAASGQQRGQDKSKADRAATDGPGLVPDGNPGGRPRTEAEASGSGPDLSGRLERMVMVGDVRLTQPGRTGNGEQLTYTAATDSFVLTGTATKPARVTGEREAVVTGATLLFKSAESTIVVAGAKVDPRTRGPARVHTETDLKQ